MSAASELIFLGTSAGSPTRHRNVAGVALRDGGRWDLFDCGEGTQHQVQRTSLSLGKLRRVFVSHLHGDHCFGLFGLLGSRSMERSLEPLTVIGPTGVRRMVETVLDASSTHLTYPLHFVEVPPEGGPVVDAHAVVEGQDVVAIPLVHRVTSFAWWIVEADRPGRVDAARAQALGVPDGPLLGRLQRGEAVTLDRTSRRIDPADVAGAPRPGRRIVIAGDNSDPDTLLAATGPVDVLVHEATFTEPVVAAIGDDHGHSTAARVALAAARHGVGHLVLTHFSARFTSSDRLGEIDDEARAHFDGPVTLADDFDRFEITVDGTVHPIHPTP